MIEITTWMMVDMVAIIDTTTVLISTNISGVETIIFQVNCVDTIESVKATSIERGVQ